MMKKLLAVLFAGFVIFTVPACTPKPDCGQGYVAEHDEDGWECEPDKNGNGQDDEEDNE